MRTRLLLQIGIFLAVGGLLPRAGYAQSQRDMVCQGGCGGGCGPCPTSGGTTAAPTAPATLNPALANAAQSIGYSLGQQLNKALFGDPAAKAVNDAANAANAAAAQQNALAAQQLNNSGIYLLKKNDPTGAIHEFQKALALAPNDASILHNLESAKQQLKDAAVAAQNSGALNRFLGGAPANAGNSTVDPLPHAAAANPNGSALSLVNLDSNVVDLRGTTTASPASLKTQLDEVFANGTPVSAPPATQGNPNEREQQIKADVDAVFDKPVPDPNATMKAIFDLNYKPK